MNRLLSYFIPLLLSSYFVLISLCAASSLERDDVCASSQTLLPLETLCLVTENLPPHHPFSRVCHAWHQAMKHHQHHKIRLERAHMLDDQRAWSQNLPRDLLTSILTHLFQEDGYVFVPFGHRPFPTGSIPLRERDVAPLLPQLYLHAFGKASDPLSPQDILCLKAVLPWQRMAVPLHHLPSKREAVRSLLRVHPNKSLVRFSPTLLPDALKEETPTIVLTTSELAAHKEALESLLKSHTNHRVHLVMENGFYVNNGRLSFYKAALPSLRHLILSDPEGVVHKMGNLCFSPFKLLQSLDARDLNALTHMESFSLFDCLELQTFDTRGLGAVISVGAPILNEALVLNDALKHQINTFKDAVKVRRDQQEGPVERHAALPEDFSAEIYLLYHPHLRARALTHGFDPITYACDHYQEMGCKQGLIYKLPEDFDLAIYLLLNPDIQEESLRHSDPEAYALQYFAHNQPTENRLYTLDLPALFSPGRYLAQNPDLAEQVQRGTDAERDLALSLHYINFGEAERRLY